MSRLALHAFYFSAGIVNDLAFSFPRFALGRLPLIFY
jgi:hypothetical protein